MNQQDHISHDLWVKTFLLALADQDMDQASHYASECVNEYCKWAARQESSNENRL